MYKAGPRTMRTGRHESRRNDGRTTSFTHASQRDTDPVDRSSNSAITGITSV